MISTRSRRFAWAAVLSGALCLAGTACGSSDDDSPDNASSTTTSTAPAAASGPLAGICPDPLVIQTAWYPEAEEVGGYALVGPDGTIDTDKGYYSGDVGGVTVQVRAGGPFIGNQSPSALLYQHPDIFMAAVSTDDGYLNASSHPTVAVFAPLQKSPLGVLWDPDKYHFDSLSDAGESGARILAAGENGATDVLVTKGVLQQSQFDFSWDNSPGRFLAGGEKDLLFDYAFSDVYNYEHNVPQYGKKLDYILAADEGYASYENSYAVTPETLDSRADCLKKVVPMLQQGEIDFINDPAPLTEQIVKEATELRSPTFQSQDYSKAVIENFKEGGLYANGTDGTFGSFDMDRVQEFIDTLGPVADLTNTDVPDGLEASDLVTNEFLDPDIHLE
jgi:hypothetical protein